MQVYRKTNGDYEGFIIMRITKEFIKRNIAGDTILVPIGDTAQNFNGMITLTDSAEFIWDNLEKTDNMDEMVQRGGVHWRTAETRDCRMYEKR